MRLLRRWLIGLAILGAACSVLAGVPSENLAPGQSLGADLGIRSLPNLRDLGGYQNTEGLQVVRGKVYRSNVLNPMDFQDLNQLAKLQLKNDYDLRTTAEISSEPDIIPSSIRYTNLNVLADDAGVAITPAQQEKLFQDPQMASEKFGGAEGVNRIFIQMYQNFVSLPSAKKAYRSLFLSLANPQKAPNVFHCTNGKDRTGWAAASLLTLLGVPKETVYEDYLRSNDYLLPFHQKQIDAFVAKGGDREILMGLFGVKRAYLDAAFDEMQKQYGSIEKYFSKGLGIDSATQKKMRAMYLSSKINTKQ